MCGPAQRSKPVPPVEGAHVDADAGGCVGNVASAGQQLQSGISELMGEKHHEEKHKHHMQSFCSASCAHNLFFSCRCTLAAAHLLVGKEVDDGVVDRASLGKVHGHGGKQRGDVEFWIHDNHH